ncbi:MAG: hypothetical protein Q9212_000906 [Teloschistes hypoglaucus]
MDLTFLSRKTDHSLDVLRIDLGLIPLGNVHNPPIDPVRDIIKKQKASIFSLQTLLQKRVENLRAGSQVFDNPDGHQAEESRPAQSDESMQQPLLLHLASEFEALMAKAATWNQEMQTMLQGDATIITVMDCTPKYNELSS